MQPNPNQPPLPEDQSRSRTTRKLIIAAALIGLAVAGLAAVDRLREPSARLAPSHEPAQALIATPVPPATDSAAQSAQQSVAPPPPQVVNGDPREPASRAPDAVPSAQSPVHPARKTSSQGVYIVQAGTFKSTANAQALQKQLQRAGIPAHLETRVQLGPFKNRRDADTALAGAKKLGIAAMLIGPINAGAGY
jgi:DedD protein